MSTKRSTAKNEVQKNATGKVKAPRRKNLRTPELIDEIMLRISDGEPLRQICRDEHMPHWTNFYEWLDGDEDLRLRFGRAREKGEEAMAAECLDIADNSSQDMIETEYGPRLNTEHVQRSKLRIETRLKLLAKWNPKKWGEKVDLNHGGQADNPIKTLVENLAGNVVGVKKAD